METITSDCVAATHVSASLTTWVDHSGRVWSKLRPPNPTTPFADEEPTKGVVLPAAPSTIVGAAWFGCALIDAQLWCWSEEGVDPPFVDLMAP